MEDRRETVSGTTTIDSTNRTITYNYVWEIENFLLDDVKVYSTDDEGSYKSPIFPDIVGDLPTSLKRQWRLCILPYDDEDEYDDYDPINAELHLQCYRPDDAVEDVDVGWRIGYEINNSKAKVNDRAPNDSVPNDWTFVMLMDLDGNQMRGKLVIYCEITVKTRNPFSKTDHGGRCLRWLQSDFDTPLSCESTTDMKLLVAGKEINVHKLVMASRSSVFKAMFDHDTVENRNNSVKIVGFRYDVILELVHFIYTGSVKQLYEDKTMAMDLLAAADKFNLDELIVICLDCLIANINVENAVDFLKLVDHYDLCYLKARAIEFIRLHRDRICGTFKFTDLPKLLILEVLVP